jgi:hypothetical protein
MSDEIFAPNIYLCAYQLHKDHDQDHPLWQNCDRLMQYFTEKNLTSHLDFSKIESDRLADPLYRPILLKDNQESIEFLFNNQPEISGFAQPLRILDSYALWFNIGYDEKNENNKNENIEILSQLNPNNSLIFPPSQTFPLLGQTIIVTLWLTDNKRSDRPNLTQLANNCYSQLFPDQPRSLIRSGKLFDSLIFEYGNPRQGKNTPHVLIWLFQSAETEEKLNKCFSQIFDLLFYYHKVVHAYQDSRSIYDQLKEYYHGLDKVLDTIQDKIDRIPLNPADDQHLPYLKEKLKALSTDSLAYDRLLRKMKDLLTTIQINFHNYQEKITKIASDLAIDQTELAFLEYFGENIAPSFQKQIEDDLKYFDQGTGLISQAIATIRSIVAIDQLQCDRQSQVTLEKERQSTEESNQKLQDQIQSIGVGIAAGAIVASCSSALIGQSVLNFIMAVICSSLTAGGAAYIQLIAIKKIRYPKYQSKFDKLLGKLFSRFFKPFYTQKSLNSQKDQDK